MPELDPADEALHEPGEDLFWNESYYFDYFEPAGGYGGYVRIGLYPNLGVVWYWACVAGPERKLVTLIDHQVPFPEPGRGLSIESQWLRAGAEVLAPREQMQVTLDGRAVRLEDPADAYRGMQGEEVELGMRLDWWTDRGAYRWPHFQDRYEIPCRVTGEIRVAGELLELDGWGHRDHSWGVRDWWRMRWHWDEGRLEDGTRFHCAGAFSPGSDLGFGFILPAGSDRFEDVTTVVAEAELGPEGIPRRGHVRMNDLALEVEPLAWAPVLCVSPDGREARFPRALAACTAADGRRGLTWVEWNQPPEAG